MEAYAHNAGIGDRVRSPITGRVGSVIRESWHWPTGLRSLTVQYDNGTVMKGYAGMWNMTNEGRYQS